MMQFASKKIVSGKRRDLHDAHVLDAPNTGRRNHASILWQITDALDTDSIEAYHRNQFVSISGLDLDSRRAPLDSALHGPAWSTAVRGIRGVRSRQVRQPTGSLDHMSETNDAHVTRWRHGSRGIAVLNVDCCPNTLSRDRSRIHFIQMMFAEIVDSIFLKNQAMNGK